MRIGEPSIFSIETQNIFFFNNFFENLKNIISFSVELRSIYLELDGLKYNYLEDQH